MKTKYFEELKPKLIYVFRINDGTHKGCLKIGEATLGVDPDEVDITAIVPNSKVLQTMTRTHGRSMRKESLFLKARHGKTMYVRIVWKSLVAKPPIS